MEDKLKEISERFRNLELEMSNPDVISDQNKFRDLNKEHSSLALIVQASGEYKKIKQELRVIILQVMENTYSQKLRARRIRNLI